MLPGATDRLFLHFCRTGSARSLGRVFDRTAPELLRVAVYLSGNRADADDLVQRTFLTAIESRASYDRARCAMPWLLGILANLARRLQRERATRRAELPERKQGDDPAAAASHRELSERITRLRGELGAPYAAVLALHLEGLNSKEIAQRLGRPAGTVRTQLMRALEMMRRHLPAGFVGALQPPLPWFTELAGIKANVLAANHVLPAASATAAATIVTGGVLMSKKLIAVCAALLLFVAGAYTAWPRGDALPLVTASADPVRTALAPPPAATVAAEAASRTSPSPQPDTPDAVDADPGFGAVRVIVRWQDGRPAAGVGVRGEGLQTARNERRIATTGSDGSCLLPHLRPAPWRIAATHADKDRTIEVRAGATEVCDLSATSVATARGRVVDDQQRPVAAADICITQRQWEVAVGRSDENGCFVLPLCKAVQVGARKAGFTPSLAQAVDPKKPPEELVLALRGKGGRVEGTVRDTQGQPIAWARVLIGMAQAMPRSFNGPYERQLFVPPGAETTTDLEGRFVLPSVEPGEEFVQAWAPGYGIAHASVEVTAGVTNCNLTMVAVGVVQGQVRDDDGKPIANAFVHPFSNQSQFVSLYASTDAEGRYRLELGPERWSLTASSEGANVTETVEVAAGAIAEWNPVLQRIAGIRGRVLGADDRGIAAVAVSICRDNGLPAGSATVTDADGAFVLQPKDQGTVDLRVGDWKGPPLKYVRSVRSGTQDLVIRITAGDLPSARLRGRIVDERGAPIRASIMAARVRESLGCSAETGPDGRFELGPLSPGRYMVRVSTPAHGSRALGQITLAPQAEHDCGELVIQMPGSAAVDVRDEDGKPTKAFVVLYDAGLNWVASMNTEQGRATFAALQPGRYLVTCGGAPSAAYGELEVLPAARAHADLQQVLVGHADVVVRDPAKMGDLDLHVLAFTGGRFAGMFGNTPGTTVRVWLPPGSYALEMRASDGRCARGELTIRGLDDHPEVTVELPAK